MPLPKQIQTRFKRGNNYYRGHHAIPFGRKEPIGKSLHLRQETTGWKKYIPTTQKPCDLVHTEFPTPSYHTSHIHPPFSSFIENAPPVRRDALCGYMDLTARRVVVKLDNRLAILVRTHVRIPIQRATEVLHRGHKGIIRILERGRHVVTLEICTANAFLYSTS